MNNFTPELYELVDEKGNRRNFEMLDTEVLSGTRYYAMIPSIDSEDFFSYDGEIIIMRSEYVDGEEMLASIFDDDEYEIVNAFFNKRLYGMFEDEECDCGGDCGCDSSSCECSCRGSEKK